MAPDASGWEVALAACLSTGLGQWLRRPLKGPREQHFGYRAGLAVARGVWRLWGALPFRLRQDRSQGRGHRRAHQ